jgi:hypothetical protein
VRTASLYRFVLAVLVLLDVLTLTHRVLGVGGSLLGSAARVGRASAHPAKSLPAYTLPIRSPVSRATTIATGTGRLNVGPRLGSCFVKVRKAGLWTPERRALELHPLYADRMQNILVNYLLHVGTLLSDGHFAEAKQVALQAKERFAKIVAESEKTKQEQKAQQRG